MVRRTLTQRAVEVPLVQVVIFPQARVDDVLEIEVHVNPRTISPRRPRRKPTA